MRPAVDGPQRAANWLAFSPDEDPVGTARIRTATRAGRSRSCGHRHPGRSALHRFTRLRHRFGLRHAVRRCRQRV